MFFSLNALAHNVLSTNQRLHSRPPECNPDDGGVPGSHDRGLSLSGSQTLTRVFVTSAPFWSQAKERAPEIPVSQSLRILAMMVARHEEEGVQAL